MLKVIFTTILVGAVCLTSGTSGESCKDKPRPTPSEVASCCDVPRDHPTPKVTEMEQIANSCLDAQKKEYEGLSEEEKRQKAGKFGKYNCLLQCIYTKIGVMNENGALEKEKFAEMTRESFPEEFKDLAASLISKCIGNVEGVDMCSKTEGMVPISKCFMAEMVVSCPEKHFNDNDKCRSTREYLKECVDTFSQG